MSKRPERYPDCLEIKPLTKPLGEKTVSVPGSKSITNRALVLAVLTARDHPCKLRGVLRSEDTEVMVAGLCALGFSILTDWETENPSATIFETLGRLIPASSAEISVANSGTTMRFLTALASLGNGRYRFDGTPRMRERPIEDLLLALRRLGVTAKSERGNGCPPVIIEANGFLSGGSVRIKGNISSQFASALLLVSPYAEKQVEITLEGTLVSEPYVQMTVAMMHQWGFSVEKHENTYIVEDIGTLSDGDEPERLCYDIEPDASAASYFWGAAAVTGGSVRVMGLNTESLQGDVRLVDLLEEMGCTVVRSPEGITVHGGSLRGIDVDMNDISDTVMTLAAVALFADGPTTIRNVAHIRHKETDRLTALATELRRVGAEVEEFEDGLRITPRPLHGAEIETYNDHRMAMSMALVGLKVPGIVIKNPECVAKTYPGFFADLEKLRC